MAKRKPKPIDQAREAALRGQLDAALTGLRECADKGDDGACASLAEMLAFTGSWQELIPYAGRLIANPFAVYAGNVFDDMVRLLGRAGHETGDWKSVASAAQVARLEVERILNDNKMKFHEVKIQAMRNRLGKILARLGKYAAGKGKPPHELVAIFAAGESVVPPTESVYRAALDSNVGKAPAYYLDLAIAFRMESEAVRIYSQLGSASTFSQVVFIARALVKNGAAEEAWQVIWNNLKKWVPVDAAQVAPVELVTDEYLRTILTPERCRQIICTARGQGANRYLEPPTLGAYHA